MKPQDTCATTFKEAYLFRITKLLISGELVYLRHAVLSTGEIRSTFELSFRNRVPADDGQISQNRD